MGEIAYDLRLLATCVTHRADVVVIQGGHKYWFLFALLRLVGIKVGPAVDGRIPVEAPRRQSLSTDTGAAQRLVFSVARPGGSLSASGEISRQVTELATGKPAPIDLFLPRFRKERFPSLSTPQRPPFRVLFAGRIDGTKASSTCWRSRAVWSRSEGRESSSTSVATAARWRKLRRQVETAGISAWFRPPRALRSRQMAQMYGQAHIVVVPTTSEFIEGFNQVVIEGGCCRTGPWSLRWFARRSNT